MTISFYFMFLFYLKVTGGGHDLVESLIHQKAVIYTLIIIFILKLLLLQFHMLQVLLEGYFYLCWF